jgi:putative ABC transport system permease protein
MDNLIADVRHALRQLWHAPSFTIAAVAALALGIGVNTAIFSVVDAVLLRPVPFADPDRLVFFENTSPQGNGAAASPAKFAHWRQQTEVIQDSAAFNTGIMNLTDGEVPEQVKLGRLTADGFKLFGVPIIRGRSFSTAEDAPKGPKVVVISQGLWNRHYGGSPDVVGKTISLSGEQYEVIGVVGQGFHFEDLGPQPDVWVPFQLDPESTDQGHYFRSAARLKPGVTLEQAQAKLKLSAEDFKARFPRALQPNNGFTVETMRSALVNNARTTLWVMIGAVAFVLLIACANVANLLLVRATTRKREIAIRAAVGAGRGRLVRQMLTESIVLATLGGIFGLLIGTFGIRALLSVNRAGLPRVGIDGSAVSMDWRVVLFTVAATIGTGILIGLIPALQSSRVDLNTTIKESASRSGSGFRQNKTRSILVVVEVALALILLVGAGLLIRTSVALAAVDPGFDSTNVLTMRMSLSGPRFVTADGVDRLIRDGVERLRALPGVELASATCCVPLQGGYGLPMTIVGRPLTNGPYHGGGGWVTASAGYFEVFKIPVKRGRVFNERDDKAGLPVVVINEAMAKQFWPNGDPLNDKLVIGRGVMREFAGEPERQIIGVVGDTHLGNLTTNPGATMYIPQAQVPDAANALNVGLTPMAWIVRTRTAPGALSAQIQEQLRKATGLPVSDVETMDRVVSLSVSRQRFNMLLMIVFAGAALLLASIGIYGLMAYSVEQRTQEIGIRMALGALASSVRRMVVMQGLWLAIVGVVIGVASSYGLARLIQSILFGVKARDPLVFIGIPIVLTVVALIAVWLPAMRASRVDPLTALRYE